METALTLFVTRLGRSFTCVAGPGASKFAYGCSAELKGGLEAEHAVEQQRDRAAKLCQVGSEFRFEIDSGCVAHVIIPA